MALNDFFVFDSKFALTNVMAVPQNLKNNEIGISDKYRLIKGLYDEVSFPIIFKQEEGKNYKDILDTGYACLYIISDRMKTVLEENFITGWKTYPIQFFDKKGNEIFGYHGFSITGRCDPIDYSKSEIMEKRLVPTGPLVKFHKGISIDNWDGSDFFTPTDTLWQIVTQNAAKALLKNKISNLNLTNLSDIEVRVK